MNRLIERMNEVEEGIERLEMRGLSTFFCISPNSLPASQEPHCWSLSLLFLCTSSSSFCQTDDRMCREGLRRRDRGRRRENRFLDSMCAETSEESFCACVCVCMHGWRYTSRPHHLWAYLCELESKLCSFF